MVTIKMLRNQLVKSTDYTPAHAHIHYSAVEEQEGNIQMESHSLFLDGKSQHHEVLPKLMCNSYRPPIKVSVGLVKTLTYWL